MSAPAAPSPPKQRSRNGCRQCRQRKRKCDERHPHCSGCLERRLDCDWNREEPGRRRRLARRHQSINRDFTVPLEMRPWMTVFTVPSTPVKDRLLAHFYATSPLWLTLGGTERKNMCRRLIMAGVARSAVVRDCVLAVAAGDLSKYQAASSDMASLTHGFYGQAVMGIRSALSRELDPEGVIDERDHEPLPNPSNLPNLPAPELVEEDDILLAILLLCVHESVNFSNAIRMIPHINAAATLCYNRSFSAAPDADLRSLLFEMFYYFFTLTASSHGQHLHLDLALKVFDSPFLAVQNYQGVLLGRNCCEIFSYIHRVNLLLNSCSDASISTFISTPTSISTHTPISISTPTTTTTSFATQLHAIEERLDALAPSEPIVDSIEPHENLATELYRIACCLYVKRSLHPELPSRSACIQELVARFIAHLELLPPLAMANGILCWPLVVAGLSSNISTHRRLITGRLRRIHETWRSDILILSVDLLSKVWREEKASAGSTGSGSDLDHQGCGGDGRRSLTIAEALKTPILLL